MRVDARFRPLENVGREVDAITQFNREKWLPHRDPPFAV